MAAYTKKNMSAASPQGIRVKIDLRNAVPTSDPKLPLSWMHVDVSQVTTVRRLCKNIKRRHALSGKYHLFLQDGVLPPDEGIGILRDNDTVTVTRATQDEDVSSISSAEPRARKRKLHDNCGDGTSAAEEGRNSRLADTSRVPDSSLRTRVGDSASPPRKKSSVCSRSNSPASPSGKVSVDAAPRQQSQKDFPSNVAEVEVEASRTTEKVEQKSRRKRIRKHKKKRTLSPILAQPMVPAFQMSTPMEPQRAAQHKFFDRSDDEDAWKCLPPPPQAAQQSIKVPDRHPPTTDDGDGDTSESSEDEEVVSVVPAPVANTTSSQNTAAREARAQKQPSTNGPEEDDVVPSYENLPPVRVPRVGDRIAFKVLEMDEHYSPQESCYREGEVLSFNPKSGQVSLHLREAIPDPSMFVPIAEDGGGPTLVHKVDYNWSHLLGPVLLEHKGGRNKT